MSIDQLASVRDQDELERAIGRQADQLLADQADEREKKRLEKTNKEKARLQALVRELEHKSAGYATQGVKDRYQAEIKHYTAQINTLDQDLDQIQKRIDERKKQVEEQNGGGMPAKTGNKRMPGESAREYLIRTGKITPLFKLKKQEPSASENLSEALLDAEKDDDDDIEKLPLIEETTDPLSHRNLLEPGFDLSEPSISSSPAGTASPVDASSPAAITSPPDTMSLADSVDDDAALARKLQDEEDASARPSKRRRLQSMRAIRAESDEKSMSGEDSDAYIPDKESHPVEIDDGVVEIGDDDDAVPTTTGRKRKAKSCGPPTTKSEQEDFAGIDDGNEKVYRARLQKWVKRRSAAREKYEARPGSVAEAQNTGDASTQIITEEWHKPHPSRPDTVLEDGYRMPGDIYSSLFNYQRTGVQWLCQLHAQDVGGILADEMGLGKTIQIIAFIAALHHSRKLKKPVIIVCPATLMKQWVNEFHKWWPALRVSILHSSGSGMLDVKAESRIEEEIEFELDGESLERKRGISKNQKSAQRIVDRVLRDGHVLVTTYNGLQSYADLLLRNDWECAVLDEGHKIRNPNTAITADCKLLNTHNRIILSGTPMQNNLVELWSVFDFVYPMRLGTLSNFKKDFEMPIKTGGYASSTNTQVEMAMKAAETLKESISPYLLQRFKVDVAADLPKKSERVLFCKLTKLQQQKYQFFLKSDEMQRIQDGKLQPLYGIDILRKICNHPDLTDHQNLSKMPEYNYGSGSKSGKMQVVKSLLQMWQREGHKTLLFAQYRIMLDILERFMTKLGINFIRMDGTTSIKGRQNLVDKFNNSPEIHVFLLTTKVGGLGVNLTGANRVIIYDPDWNPSTDMQARERAWRLGQKREVQIYRLMSAGTLEEKIYHRQIFKQFLSNKILKDPKQRQTFHLKDLHDLFSLGPDTAAEDFETKGEAEMKGIFGIDHQEDFKSNDVVVEKGEKRVLSSLFGGN